ncbi:hypothetical protein AB2L28_10585 [Kineococcus sp. TBRC 1896]|uniref:Uncharacterized protein n=1 Tax=Kineococcus mangrovi TaxID=1660183 RepID=A0ABV4I1X5_9ACTN
MSGLVVLVVLGLLVALALAAPFAGVDTRWPGAGTRADRPSREKRYRLTPDFATAEVRRDEFGRTS